MEHMRPEGLSQGGYCPNCGAPGMNMYGSGHTNLDFSTGPAYFCKVNIELVQTLKELNK